MENKKLTKRNLIGFSIGTFGRDAATQGLFVNQIMNFVYFTKVLSVSQFAVLSVLLVVFKVFDAINDPVMGNIIDATKTRWGKFKPWIFLGMIGTSAVILASFCNNLNGWAYVAFFGIMYFMFSIVFTMNDAGYWGMIPSLAKSSEDRNKLTSTTALFANFGGIVAGILIPILTTGNLAIGGSSVTAYAWISVIFVILFIIFQSITLICVKEDKESKDYQSEEKEKVSFKTIFNVFKNNDQFRWISIIYLLTQIVPNAAITFFIYFQYGYQGILTTLFYVFSTIASLLMYVLYPSISKKKKRGDLLKLATISAIVGYMLVILACIIIPKDYGIIVIPIVNVAVTLQFLVVALCNFFVGFASTTFYLVLMICLANTTEYNDLKTGKRMEGIIFSTRAFLVQFGQAIATFFIMIFYMLIGINEQTDAIANLEQQASMGLITGEEKMILIEEIINSVSTAKCNALLILITVVPMLLLISSYILYKKKYIIDEKYFDDMIKQINAKKVGESNV